MREIEGGQSHVMQIGDIKNKWEQIAEVPVVHRTQTNFDGTVKVEHLFFLHESVDLIVNSAGDTIEDAEADMRNALSRTLEFGEVVELTPQMVEMQNEISRYFKLKKVE